MINEQNFLHGENGLTVVDTQCRDRLLDQLIFIHGLPRYDIAKELKIKVKGETVWVINKHNGDQNE